MNQFNLFQKIETKTNQENRNNNTGSVDAFRNSQQEISWQQLILKILTAMKVPLIAAKHQLITSVKKYLSTHPFPWFRIALVLLFVYVFFKKDMHFNINMGAPPAVLSEDNERHADSKLTMGSFSAPSSPKTKKKTGRVNLNDADVAAYIKRFTKVALVEMEKFGIPASVKMGQAILASQAGKNKLANQVNNHFGVTCEEGANCRAINIGQQNRTVRTYQSAWESWRDHSNILASPNYMHLKENGKNYKKWAKGLASAGYGGANYSAQLIQVIERYQLFRLDEQNTL